MSSHNKAMAGFAVCLVAGAMITALFAGPWPIIGAVIALLILCGGSSPNTHVQAPRRSRQQRR